MFNCFWIGSSPNWRYEDTINQFGEMWVFGKDKDQTEIYIKISLGTPNSHVICISFHKAEKEIHYAFK